MPRQEPPESEDTATLDYGSALSELEKLVSDMEQGLVDIDQLATKVKRAAYLVSYCRERLDGVTADVEALATSLISPEGDSP